MSSKPALPPGTTAATPPVVWDGRTSREPHKATEYWHSGVIETGLRDGKGRTVGCVATVTQWQAGEPLEVLVQGTRDGLRFGAIPVRAKVMAPTLDEAKRTAETKLGQWLTKQSKKT